MIYPVRTILDPKFHCPVACGVGGYVFPSSGMLPQSAQWTQWVYTASSQASSPSFPMITFLALNETTGSQQIRADWFAGTSGGERIAAIHDWVARKFTYAPGSSDAHTTALDSFVERRGICRDFAHMVVTLARASAIPARYVAAYGPDVSPQDFHAVAEVFLDDPASEDGGTWQLVDATGMASPDEIVKIGVGRDAADVSFLTSFGLVELCEKHVSVVRN